MKKATGQNKISGWACAALFAGISAVSLASSSPAHARPPATTAETMLDRIQIEEMIVNYYADLGSDLHENFSEYFVEDAVFILNGNKYVGRKAITEVYAELGASASRLSQGITHMLLTNAVINVDGDTATATTIWTGVINDNIKIPPRVFEQGREYDKLVKKDGIWYFSERIIASDSALQDKYDDTYLQYRPSDD